MNTSHFINEFWVLNKKHYLVFHQSLRTDLLNTFVRDLKQVIRRQAAVFNGTLPYENYTFFFHLREDLDHPDGMEHLNSCRVLLRMNPRQIKTDANSDPDYDNLIWLSAHEFFHTWNIKRLRPNGLGPFDYSKESYTPSLWIVEGLTSYYAYLSLIRSGIFTPQKLYSEFAGRIKRYEHDPGKNHRSLSEVSMLTWLFKGHVPQYESTNIEETTYSYYYKGLIVGLLLDLKIRASTAGMHSLDDVFQHMYEQFYLGAQNNYYLSGHGYSERDFEHMAEIVAGTDLKMFFNQSIYKIQPLDYKLLNAAGLQLTKKNESFEITPLAIPDKMQQKILNGWLKGE